MPNSDIRLGNLSNSGLPHPMAYIRGDAQGNLLMGPAGSFEVAGADVGNTYRDTSPAALHGRRASVLAQPADYVLERHLSGLVLCNTGAEEPVTFRLPPAEAGLQYTLVKTASPKLTVAAAPGDRIGDAAQWVNAASAAGGRALDVVAVDGERWVVVGAGPNWKPRP